MPEVLLLADSTGVEEEVRRLAAAANLTVQVAHDPVAAIEHWGRASLIIVGPTWLPTLMSLVPPRRNQVWLVSDQPPVTQWYADALQLGAHGLITLPDQTDELGRVLTQLESVGSARAATVAVMAGCGGAGATVLAAGLAGAAAAHADTLLIETDPLSAGALSGGVPLAGFGWEALQPPEVSVSASSLRENVTRADRLGVLTWHSAQRSPLQAGLAAQVLAVAKAGHAAVVLDLQPRQTDLNRALLMGGDQLVVISHAASRCLQQTARVLASYGRVDAMVVLREPTKGTAAVSQARSLTQAERVWLLPDHKRVEEHLDLGVGLLALRRSAFAKACTRLWEELLQ